MAHTPGPWEVSDEDPPRILAADSRQTIIAITTAPRANAKNMADAHLIAAAPGLLAACLELREALAGAMRVIATSDQADLTDCFVDEIARLGIPNGIGLRADAAIAKAGGVGR